MGNSKCFVEKHASRNKTLKFNFLKRAIKPYQPGLKTPFPQRGRSASATLTFQKILPNFCCKF